MLRIKCTVTALCISCLCSTKCNFAQEMYWQVKTIINTLLQISEVTQYSSFPKNINLLLLQQQQFEQLGPHQIQVYKNRYKPKQMSIVKSLELKLIFCIHFHCFGCNFSPQEFLFTWLSIYILPHIYGIFFFFFK